MIWCFASELAESAEKVLESPGKGGGGEVGTGFFFTCVALNDGFSKETLTDIPGLSGDCSKSLVEVRTGVESNYML